MLHLAACVSSTDETPQKGICMHITSSPANQGLWVCFQNLQAVTADGFILPHVSLLVWQKNWKWTDYVYLQNRAYQSVIRPLWCSFLYLQLMSRVISVLSPPRMCRFPSGEAIQVCLFCLSDDPFNRYTTQRPRPSHTPVCFDRLWWKLNKVNLFALCFLSSRICNLQPTHAYSIYVFSCSRGKKH